MNFDHKGHLRSHKVIFAFEKKNVSLISFSFKFVSTYWKLSQNDNFLKSRLTFLWTTFVLVSLKFLVSQLVELPKKWTNHDYIIILGNGLDSTPYNFLGCTDILCVFLDTLLAVLKYKIS